MCHRHTRAHRASSRCRDRQLFTTVSSTPHQAALEEEKAHQYYGEVAEEVAHGVASEAVAMGSAAVKQLGQKRARYFTLDKI